MFINVSLLVRTISYINVYSVVLISKDVRVDYSSFNMSQEKLRVLFMQSDGGLTPMVNFNGSRAILSGPAGGVVSSFKLLY